MRIEFKGKLDILSVYTHRDIELDYESDIDELGPKNCRESF